MGEKPRTTRPALLLDVDGPLNPYAAAVRPNSYVTRQVRVHEGPIRNLRVRLNPGHGPAIMRLAEKFDLIWATTWEHLANVHISPEIGIPQDLPVIEFGRMPARPLPEFDLRHGIFWKTETIARVMADRFFVWIDDDVTAADAEYLAKRHQPGSVVYPVNPAKGLLAEDFTQIDRLADGTTTGLVTAPPSSPGRTTATKASTVKP